MEVCGGKKTLFLQRCETTSTHSSRKVLGLQRRDGGGKDEEVVASLHILRTSDATEEQLPTQTNAVIVGSERSFRRQRGNLWTVCLLFRLIRGRGES